MYSQAAAKYRRTMRSTVSFAAVWLGLVGVGACSFDPPADVEWDASERDPDASSLADAVAIDAAPCAPAPSPATTRARDM